MHDVVFCHIALLFRMCFDTFGLSPVVQFHPQLSCSCTHQHTQSLKTYAEVVVHAFFRSLTKSGNNNASSDLPSAASTAWTSTTACATALSTHLYVAFPILARTSPGIHLPSAARTAWSSITPSVTFFWASFPCKIPGHMYMTQVAVRR